MEGCEQLRRVNFIYLEDQWMGNPDHGQADVFRNPGIFNANPARETVQTSEARACTLRVLINRATRGK